MERDPGSADGTAANLAERGAIFGIEGALDFSKVSDDSLAA